MSVKNLSIHSHEEASLNTPEYLSWRRLHLSKSKLDNVAELGSFMSGFAVVATVELQINDADANPILLTSFVITTALLVSTSMIAIVIATCILPHIQAVAKMSMISQVNQSPHDDMTHLIDIAWVLANTASLFFFTLDVILMCWIKFTFFSWSASVAATCIMAPVLLIILLFGIIFYRKIIKHQYVISNLKYEELERMKSEIDKQASVLVFNQSKSSSIRSNATTGSMKSNSTTGSIKSSSSDQSAHSNNSYTNYKIGSRPIFTV